MEKTKLGLSYKISNIFLLFALTIIVLIGQVAAEEESIELKVNYYGLKFNEEKKWEIIPLQQSFQVFLDEEALGLVQGGAWETLHLLSGQTSGTLHFVPQGLENKFYAFDDTVTYTYNGEKELNINLWAYAAEGLFSIENTIDGLAFEEEAVFAVINEKNENILEFKTENGLYNNEGAPIPTGHYRLKQLKAPMGVKETEEVSFAVEPYINQKTVTQITFDQQLIINKDDQITLKNDEGQALAIKNEKNIEITIKNRDLIKDEAFGIQLPNANRLDEMKTRKLLDEKSIKILKIFRSPRYDFIVLELPENSITGEISLSLALEEDYHYGEIHLYTKHEGIDQEGGEVSFQGSLGSLFMAAALENGRGNYLITPLSFAQEDKEENIVYVAGENRNIQTDPKDVVWQSYLSETVQKGPRFLALPEGMDLIEAPIATKGNVYASKEENATSKGPWRRIDDVTDWATIRSLGITGTDVEVAFTLMETIETDQSITVTNAGGNSQEILLIEKSASLTAKGHVFNDQNQNGKQDEGETGIENKALFIKYKNDPYWYTSKTNLDGSFAFYQHGEKTVEEMIIELPLHAESPFLQQISSGLFILNVTGDPLKVEVPVFSKASVQVQMNEKDTSLALAGVKVSLIQKGRFLGEQTTNDKGVALFEGLEEGNYVVQAALLDGDETKGFLSETGIFEEEITIRQGEKAVVEVPFTAFTTLEVEGALVAESPIEIEIYQKGNLIQKALLKDKIIKLEGLYPGEYDVVITIPEGVVLQSVNGQKVQVKNSHAFSLLLANKHEAITLQLAPSGNAILKGISAIKEDSLLKGKLTGEETLDFTIKGANDQKFNNLIPGEYILSLILPDYIIQEDFENNNWQLQKGAVSTVITIEAGKTTTLPPLSLQAYGDITGSLWDDLNEDGKQGEEELLLSGITIQLQMKEKEKERYTPVKDELTDKKGEYAFTQLVPGTYRLVVMLPEEGRVTSHQGESKKQQFSFLDIQLDNGESVTFAPIGITLPSGIEAFAFWDSNNDGKKGVYERPIPGTQVNILDEKGQMIASASTDQEGRAAFKEMMPGKYRAQFILPEGYWLGPQGEEGKILHSSPVQEDGQEGTSSLFTVEQGQITSVAVGGEKTASLSGSFWEDINGNGVMEPEEPAMADARVVLQGKKTGATYTITADSQGNYKQSLRPDTYVAVYSAQEGYIFTRYSSQGGKNRSLFTASRESQAEKQFVFKETDAITDQNVGWIKESLLTGQAFIDDNYNGLKNQDEKALSGVEVTLSRYPSNELIEKTVTDEKGTFSFSTLRGDTYRVQATLPDENLVYTIKGQEGGEMANAFDGLGTSKTGEAVIEVADAAEKVIGLGALYPASFRGQAFLDANYSGTMDNQEPGLQNVKISLYNQLGELVEQSKTNGEGKFAFLGLMPGEYYLTGEILDGYTITKQSSGHGANILTLSEDTYGRTEPLHLKMGEEKESMLFGFLQAGKISGNLYTDQNDNGLWDEDEVGQNAIDANLYSEDGQLLERAVTSDKGYYSFEGVLPGSYYIAYTMGDRQAASKDLLAQGVFEVADEHLVRSLFTMEMGQEEEIPALGVVDLGFIQGNAFYDANGNGYLDEDEKPLTDVNLEYFPLDSPDEKATLKPDADGNFSFDYLRPGQYQINVSLTDERQVLSREGDEALLTGATGQKQGTRIIDLLAGQEETGLTIGAVKYGSMTGDIWLDQNDNGIKENTDLPLENIKVFAADEQTGEVAATAFTNPKGEYELAQLLPGSYTIKIEVPQGFGEGKWGQGVNEFRFNQEGYLAKGQVQVINDEVNRGQTALMVRYTTLQGTVWTHTNGEKTGLEGVMLQLHNIGQDEVVAQSMTPVTGNYMFAGLRPGEYQIEMILPGDYIFVKKSDPLLLQEGYQSVVENTQQGVSLPIAIIMGQDVTGADVGAILPGKIGDTAWLDENQNGLQDDGEPALQGLEVYLYQNDQLVATTVTDEYGYYLFDQVYPTVSQIRVQRPKEVIPTSINTDLPLLASILTGYDDEVAYSEVFTLISGDKNFNCDLGFILVEEGIYPKELAMPPRQNWLWQE